MRLAQWRTTTARYLCAQQRNVLCIVLPFIEIPGIYERLVPHGDLHYLSPLPRDDAEVAELFPLATDGSQVPLLNLHTDLVAAYWAASRSWTPWLWLEEGFTQLRRQGFRFRVGNVSEYTAAIVQAASGFAAAVQRKAEDVRATALLVYGRGHWSMNAAAVAASRLELPLFVVERGILPATYIVDLTVPFPAPDSGFRQAWERFADVADACIVDGSECATSRWDLYIGQGKHVATACHAPPDGSVVLAGQCMFDYNCLNAPFRTPAAFVEYAMVRLPDTWGSRSVIYRPHPLSPEEYQSGAIQTHRGLVPIDMSTPRELLSRGLPICSWNSTLGLEALLFYGGRAKALDPYCYYAAAENATGELKLRFLTFLKEISTET